MTKSVKTYIKGAAYARKNPKNEQQPQVKGLTRNVNKDGPAPKKFLERDLIINHIRETIGKYKDSTWALETAAGLAGPASYTPYKTGEGKPVEYAPGPEANMTKDNTVLFSYVVEGADGGTPDTKRNPFI